MRLIFYAALILIIFLSTRRRQVCPLIEKFTCPIQYHKGVPNIIFRTHAQLTARSDMVKYACKSWVDLNPTFNIIWYTDDDCNRWMKANMPTGINAAYDLLVPGAYKADLWRLCILYKYGGVYVDAFARPFLPIKKLIHAPFVSVLDAGGVGVHNGLIISQPRHPFLKQAIDDIISNVQTRYYGSSPLDVTGDRKSVV